MTDPLSPRGLAVRLLSAAFCSGMGVMMIELSATRAMAPVFGSSLYTWTNVIGVILLALTVGYVLGGRLADARPDPTQLGRLLVVAALLVLPAAFFTVPLASWLMPSPGSISHFEATGHVVRGSLVVAILLFAPPAILMGMVTPFVTRCLLLTGMETGRAAGRTLAVSTTGSLIGTYLPAHLLIMTVGTRGTLLLSAGLVALAGALLGIRSKRVAASATVVTLCLVGIGIFAGAGTILGPLPGGVAQGASHETALLLEEDSAYQYVRVTRWETPAGKEVRLSLDEGVLEFHSVAKEGRKANESTGYYYDGVLLLPELVGPSDGLSAVVLGGGAGTMAAMLSEYASKRSGMVGNFEHTEELSVATVGNVEIDPVVSSLSERFGWRPRPGDFNVVADARVFLASTSKRFDIIVLDAYARQIAIPFHLATREFFELVAARLTDDGVFAANVSVQDLKAPLFRSLHRTLSSVFKNVAVMSVDGSWNVLVLGSKQASQTFLPLAVGDELDELRRQFRSGIYRVPVFEEAPILTDDHAPLELLARQR